MRAATSSVKQTRDDSRRLRPLFVFCGSVGRNRPGAATQASSAANCTQPDQSLFLDRLKCLGSEIVDHFVLRVQQLLQGGYGFFGVGADFA